MPMGIRIVLTPEIFAALEAQQQLRAARDAGSHTRSTALSRGHLRNLPGRSYSHFSRSGVFRAVR